MAPFPPLLDRPYRHAGRELGTGTQIGTSLGVALANKGSGRLVVDLQPDGDLMYDAGAIWIAAKYQIPLLIVMYNNGAYYNDWNHQIVMARTRGTDLSRAHIGMDLFGPAPDFAGLNHQPAQRRNRVTAIFEHARVAFDMARGVTLAQLAEQVATLGEIHGGLPLSIDVQVPVDRAH